MSLLPNVLLVLLLLIMIVIVVVIMIVRRIIITTSHLICLEDWILMIAVVMKTTQTRFTMTRIENLLLGEVGIGFDSSSDEDSID